MIGMIVSVTDFCQIGREMEREYNLIQVKKAICGQETDGFFLIKQG